MFFFMSFCVASLVRNSRWSFLVYDQNALVRNSSLIPSFVPHHFRRSLFFVEGVTMLFIYFLLVGLKSQP